MRSSATSYPTRRKSSYWYMPLVPLACVCLMLIGLGLWVHFTLRMYYSVQQAEAILRLSSTNLPENLDRIYNALVGTAVVYCIFSAVIMGLGVWKGWIESDQDLQGRLYEHVDWVMYANLIMQCAWGLVMIWLVLMVAGDAVFAGWLYVARNALSGAITVQSGLTSNQTALLPPNPRFVCPAACFNANILAFINSDASVWNNGLCTCDLATIQAAYDAIQYGYEGVGGLLTGIMFMYVYGIFLAYYLVAMFTQLRTCQDFNERLLGIAK